MNHPSQVTVYMTPEYYRMVTGCSEMQVYQKMYYNKHISKNREWILKKKRESYKNRYIL